MNPRFRNLPQPDEHRASARNRTKCGQCINALDKRPLLVYVNCCQGDAAGYLGIGRQVNVPAVLANRTKAVISAARAQAMSVWKRKKKNWKTASSHR